MKGLLQSRWRLYLTIGTFGVLAVLIYTLRQEIVDVITNLGKVNTTALLLMIPLQAWNYDNYARLYQHLFAIVSKPVKYLPMYRFTLELNFVNHILPSGGVSGISYFNLRARTLGISPATSTLVQVTKLFLLYLSFQPLLIVGLLLLASRGHVNNLILVVATVLITLLVVGTVGTIYMIESRKRINSFLTFLTKALNRLVKVVRPRQADAINIQKAQEAFNELHDNYQVYKKNWRQLKKPFFFMMLANITEIATLYVVYVAFGQYVNVGAVILAYAVANFAGLISVLPAGIGIYEALMTGVLAATGIPAELSIPVTLMYRVLSMFIQLVPGYFLYQKALSEKAI